MGKFLSSFSFLLILAQFTFAQNRAISGKVTSAEDGEPIPGVSVMISGTTTGTVTDIDGNYSINVNDGNRTLRFSFVGMQSQDVAIGTSSEINVVLQPDVQSLSEVVVTALGVSRDERSIGYAIQTVQGDRLTNVREPNLVGALAGKIAGVQVIGASGAAVGGTQNIRIRGVNALGGGSPLFVVDGTPISNQSFSPNNDLPGRDYGNLAADINPDDIESISVLKGPSAAALYGNRAANGVIIITTKKGKAGTPGIGVEINHSTTFDRVYVLPRYQNEYAGGYTQDFIPFEYNPAVHPASWAAFDGQPMLNYAADESWGPRMDGTPVRHWDSWYPGENFGELRPLLPQPNNIRNFFDTGVTFNTGVSMAGGGETSNFRLSVNNVDQKGVIPNSSIQRNTVGFNGNLNLTDKLTAGINFNFTETRGLGRPASGYTGRNPVNSFNQWFQRQVDMDRLRNYKNPDGTFRTWNIRSPSDLRPLYWDNPYYEVFENAPRDKRDRVFGNFNLGYQFNEHLKLSGFVRTDFFNQKIEERIASGGLDLDSYGVRQIVGREDNYEFLAQYDRSFGDFAVNANFGGNIRRNTFDLMSQETVGGLSIPNFYNIDASVDRPINRSFNSLKVVRSLYGSLSLGYQNTIFIDATLRNDWSSALPANNNSYIYPSVSTSFVFSEVLGGNRDFLSYGKLRLSYAQVGSDIDPYAIANVYQVGLPFGSMPNLGIPNTFPNPDLRPALSSSYEAGIDLRFWNGRLNMDFTYYRNDNKDQIINLTVPGSSGYTGAFVNAGNIRSQGFELMLGSEILKRGDFTWETTLNVARNINQVVELAEGLDNRLLQSAFWGMTLNARVGQPWGTFIGNGFTTNESGTPVIREDGSYVVTQNKILGSVLPDFTGGWSNTFRYKNWDLTAFIEFQVGGQFYSVTKMFNAYSGLSAETAGLNDRGIPMRDPVDEGGGIRVDGISETGDPLSVYRDPYDHFSGMFALHERWLYDATYVKFRELRLGYSLPKKLVNRTPFQTANMAIIARNLWLIHTNVDGLDPSELGSGANGFAFFESGQLPGVRSIGFNIRLGL